MSTYHMCNLLQSVGARSPYRCNYKVGVNKDGRITALELRILNNQVCHPFNLKWKSDFRMIVHVSILHILIVHKNMDLMC